MTSIVIPAYNASSVVETTVPSILAQENIDEIIWVDDGSQDGSAECIQDLIRGDVRAKCLKLSENRGRSVARNSGIRSAEGDIIVFFDVDVEPHPSAARKLASVLNASGVVASVAQLQPVPTDPSDPYQDYAAHFGRGPSQSHVPGDSISWRFFLSGACAVRRGALESAGGFREDVPYGEDVALACDLSIQNRNGLVLSDAHAKLHDLGTLKRAVAHAAQFGASQAGLPAKCDWTPRAAMDKALPFSAVLPPLELVFRVLASPAVPAMIRRRSVRYLLATTALSSYRRARTRTASTA